MQKIFAKVQFQKSRFGKLVFSIGGRDYCVFVGIACALGCNFFIIVPVLVAIFASTPRLNSPLKVLNKLIPKRVIIENGMIEFLCDEGSQWDYLENIKTFLIAANGII